ncbi:MAG: hypothetical protein JNN05_07735 [Candidatus Omnitrophica bacterium]|nr:hypothetical protein [Candidatus Omnitrophota bacterium]
MDDALAKRGRSLEEAFFIDRDNKLIAERKRLEEMQKTKEVLTQVSGIRDSKLLDQLIALNMSPASLASLMIFPLVAVAWADGQLSDVEKTAVLEAAASQGIKPQTPNYAILEAWLSKPPAPSLLDVWIDYIRAIRGVMQPQEFSALQTELLQRAQKVAGASGGVLGIGKVSTEEKAVLNKMQDAFK